MNNVSLITAIHWMFMQPLKDWHLLLIVLVFVALDVVLLTLVSVFDTARLQPVIVPDVEHSPSVNVGCIVYRLVYANECTGLYMCMVMLCYCIANGFC